MSFLLHTGATVMCTHGGTASPTTVRARVRVGGQPAVKVSATWTVAGCPFATPEPAPKPCATIQFTTPATRVRIEGEPAVLSTASGMCNGPLGVQGTPMVTTQQVRVKGK